MIGCGCSGFHSVEFFDLSRWLVAQVFVEATVVEPGDVLHDGELDRVRHLGGPDLLESAANRLHSRVLASPYTSVVDVGDSFFCKPAASPFESDEARDGRANNRTAPADRNPGDNVNQCDSTDGYNKPPTLRLETCPFLVCHSRNLGKFPQCKP
jgi:hypothetical protein